MLTYDTYLKDPDIASDMMFNGRKGGEIDENATAHASREGFLYTIGDLIHITTNFYITITLYFHIYYVDYHIYITACIT